MPLNFACLSSLAPVLCFPSLTNMNPGLARRNPGDRMGKATGSHSLTPLGLQPLHPDALIGVSDTRGPGAVIPFGRDISYLTSPQHTHPCSNFPETTGAARTGPHTHNVRSRQGLSRQGKDLGISFPEEVAWRSALDKKRYSEEATRLTAKQVTSFIFHHNLKR